MQEWYLMNSNTYPNEIGGFENDSFLEHKDDSFSEVMETDLATTVKLFSSDLSEFKQIRCIVQDNTPNTQLKSIERTILTHIGTLKAGMYVFFENRYWLISGYPGNNKIYEKATMILCQYKLRWQLDNGRIIERWANFTSASKYDVGESGNTTIVLSSNNFTVWISEDDDSFTLDGKRVFIDRAKKNPEKVFKITRSDDVLYIYGEEHGGILSFIADKTELNLETDNQELRICDYHAPTDSNVPELQPSQSVSIIGNENLKIGFERTYTVSFDNEDVQEFSWNIESDFKVQKNIDGNKIKLFVDDEDFISSSFLLQIITNSGIKAEKKITVVEGF